MTCCYADKCKQLHCNDSSGCMIKLKLDYLYREAGVSEKNRSFRNLRVDADGTDSLEFARLSQIEEAVVSFVAGGNNLLIHGNQPGTGKTSWALRLLQSYFKKIWLNTSLTCRALFISVPEYLSAAKISLNEPNEYFNHINKYLADCDLVIWDDIGTKVNATAFEADLLLSKLDIRINNGKANIFTSNLSDDELYRCFGDRLGSRICRMSENIVFHGGDKRGWR